MSRSSELLERYRWWTALKHGGLLIAPSKLAEFYPESIEPLPRRLSDRLRRGLIRAERRPEAGSGELLDIVLEQVLGLDVRHWQKGPQVEPQWSLQALSGEWVKPRRVWQSPGGGFLPVFFENPARIKRLGIGRGRRPVSRVVEWLRKIDRDVALLTNGRQWRLIHAGPDYDAWCEWDGDLWFEEGRPSLQVDALRLLLAPESLEPPEEDADPKLVGAIRASRKGQAELSSELGERVRRAVELLIKASASVLNPLDRVDGTDRARRDIYIAATRIVMRCVVILFAEARDLLPRDHPVYTDSYGLEGLRNQLAALGGGRVSERLRNGRSAWPRLMALFRLIYYGSTHEAFTTPRYGGGLFRPGEPDAADGVLRALAALEALQNEPDDETVFRMLELLTRSWVKVRQGNVSRWVMAPVDFSDLSSEYIGILYEGLLDFELRRADREPMLFLSVGDQPVLPFRVLDTMSNDDLAQLFEKLGTRTAKRPATETESEGEEEDEEDLTEEPEADEEAEEEPVEADEADREEEEEEDLEADDRHREVRERVQIWAERAVKAAAIVAYPADDSDPQAREAFQQDVAKQAKRLVSRIVMPGEWFLVRWGGTRKGSGTFYTRPQLAGPTVRRSLEPLAFSIGAGGGNDDNQERGQSGAPDPRPKDSIPKTPEEILSVRVCDPAMGSGSFLVSALRYLTEALLESLYRHGRLEPRGDGTICRLADGRPADDPSQELLPVPPDHPDFEERLRARLKRHVVERCVYGVDLDPLAVELARMALWVETMDRDLPFGFLDHKLKCGNALVGCWFDRFRDYPVMAWERLGGDENHTRFVHHARQYEITRGKRKGQVERRGDPWTAAIKEGRKQVKTQMEDWIKGQPGLPFLRPGETAEGVHDQALQVYRELHSLPVHQADERARIFGRQFVSNPELQRLKEAFDTWCATWFWPGEAIDLAPMPTRFLDPGEETREHVNKLAARLRFFHWELEFPDVFDRPGAGFEAIVGNPPWDIQKPSSKEFFSNKDPLYRTYGKQQALDRQVKMFEERPEVEAEWLSYRAHFKALSNWVKHVGYPFGDPEDEGGRFSFGRSVKKTNDLHRMWRSRRTGRRGYADPAHPFRYQGSADLNTYKMFLEGSHALLCDSGYMGMLSPSGLYTDKGATPLRQLFLERCSWEWLFGFENREKVFDIDSRFKFCPVIVQKKGRTENIRAAFMHRRLEDWEEAEQHVLAYPRERVEQFSPNSRAILEIRSPRDLEVLTKLYDNGVLLGDQGPDGWGIQYTREFDMTNDSHLFPPRPEWEAKGYRPDEYGHWLKGGWRDWDGSKSILRRPRGLVLSQDGRQVIDVEDIEDVALPLYEGRMIGQFDFSQKGWVSGKGRGAVWRDIPFDAKVIEPQFLLGLNACRQETSTANAATGLKIAFMDVTSATNARTMVAAVLLGYPCGNSAPVLTSMDCHYALAALLNSAAYDYLARARCGGTHLNHFVIAETSLPGPDKFEMAVLEDLSLAQSGPHLRYAVSWKRSSNTTRSWREEWRVSNFERLRARCQMEAVSGKAYKIDNDTMRWILRDSDYPKEMTKEREFVRRRDPKGFWRVDKDKDPELRHTVLAQIAFHDLQEKGLQAFLDQNDGEGWMIPETVRLADYGLGHDDRAKEHQPVASRLGPRFYDWQLEQSVEESWEECEAHAELIGRIVPLPDIEADEANEKEPPEGQKPLFGEVAADSSGIPKYGKK